jgi:hypothetical protein
LADLNGCAAFDLTSSVQDHFALSHYEGIVERQ